MIDAFSKVNFTADRLANSRAVLMSQPVGANLNTYKDLKKVDVVKLFDTPQLSGILHFQTLFFIIVRADITQRRM